MHRNLAASASNYTAKTKVLDGREYLVVPVVALVEGVVQAMNSLVPELVTAESFKDAAFAFNGRPLYLGHPVDAYGVPVSGNDPQVATKSIGRVYNTKVKNKKLTMEAWVDVEAALARGTEGEDLIERIRANQVIEISVGVAADEIDEAGTFNGKEYADKWGPISPDHLALLPRGHEGACSVEMGCGVRAAQAKNTKGAENAMKHMYTEWLTEGPETEALLKTLRNIPQSERDKLPKEDFAGPNESFPIVEPVDVHDAAQSLGRAKGNRASIKRKVVAIAYRKGDSFVAQLPDDWKRATSQKAATLFQRVLSVFKGMQGADEMSDQSLRSKLSDALREKEGANFYCVEAFSPVVDPAHVVYTMREPTGQFYDWGEPVYDYVCYERAFDLSDAGVVTVNDARIEVQLVQTFEPSEGASPSILAAEAKDKNAAASAPCSCKKALTVPAEPALEELKTMKDTTKKVLEALTPEQEDAIVAFAGNGFKAAEKVVETVKEVMKEVPVEMTREQAIEKFGLGDAVKAAEARKTASVAAIKACKGNKFSDAQLAAKGQDELDAILALTGTAVKAASVDFGGQGGAKDESNEGNVDAAPSIDDRIKAARAVKK
jgi:hypothetical protein